MKKKRRTFTVAGGWDDFVRDAKRQGKKLIGDQLFAYSVSADPDPILVHELPAGRIEFSAGRETRRTLAIIADYTPEALSYLDALQAECAIQRRRRPLYNEWLIEQHLDKGRPSRELEPEWLERRKAAGAKDLDDPLASMRVIIGRERRRRAADAGETDH
jgi:hypothetical protein